MACNCTKIIEMQVENDKLMKTMEGVISNLKEENERLKTGHAILHDCLKIFLTLKPDNSSLLKENEKLKTENDCFKDCADTLIELQQKYSSLLKENEKLKRENAYYSETITIRDNDRAVHKIMSERADYYQAMLALEKHVEELKHEIEQLNQSKLYSTKEWNDLRDENAQLKAQLQNSDKASQVEQTPHPCPACQGTGRKRIYNTCISCKGRGIVWKSSNNTKIFKAEHGFCDTQPYLEIKKCLDCDGSGRGWCLTCNSTGIIVESKL